MKNNKKSLSPVIATVLLIAIVIVLALIIFLWAKGFISETVMKNERNAEQACNEINLEVSYSSGELQLSNKGNVFIYRFDVRGISPGKKEKVSLGEKEKKSLGAGESDSFSIGEYEKIEVYPLVLGTVGTSKKAYTCKRSFIAEQS